MRINIRPQGTITAPFGEVSQLHPRGHRGIDFSCVQGTELTSPFQGVVESVRDYGSTNLGKAVFIKLENGYRIAFGHLSNYNVKLNDIVNTGDVIGLCGSTGRSTGSHLHFSMYDTAGNALNPDTIFFGYKITFDYFTNYVVEAFMNIGEQVLTLSI